MAPTHNPSAKPGLKLTRALKSAALLPGRVAVKGIRAGTGRRSTNPFAPRPGEEPLVILRLQVLGCKNLLAKDRGGTSDPFVVASILNARFHTPVSKKTLNPSYNAKDATFDFPLYESLAHKLGVLELVVWDKDLVGKDYLGEVGVGLEDWFVERESREHRERERARGAARGGREVDHDDDDDDDEELEVKERPLDWDDPDNKPFSLNLLSTRARSLVTGSVQIKLGFVVPPGASGGFNKTKAKAEYFEEVYGEFVKKSRPSLVSAPATEGVGTVRSHHVQHPLFEDDGGLSSEDDANETEDDEDGETDDGESDDGETDDGEGEESSTAGSSMVDVSDVGLGGGGGGGGSKTAGDAGFGFGGEGLRSGSASTSTTTTAGTTSDTKGKTKHGRGLEVDVNAQSPTTPTLERLGLADTPRFGEMPVTATVANTKGGGGSGSGTTPLSATSGGTTITTTTTTTTTSGKKEAGKPETSRKVSGLSKVLPIPKMKFPRVGSKKGSSVVSVGSSASGDLSSASAAAAATSGGGAVASGYALNLNPPYSTSSSSSSVPTVGSLGSSPALSVSGDDTSPAASKKGRKRFRKSKAKSVGEGVQDGEGKTGKGRKGRRGRGKGKGGKGGKEYSLGGHDNDIVGIVLLEIQGAEDLPRLSNMTRTGWDMDPFVVISFGKKVFRTRVIRHSRNPVWDEKLLFHVRRYESGFKVHFSILDWDKLSSNDHIGDVSFDVKELLESAPQPDPATGLYAEEEGGGNHPMKEMKLDLVVPPGAAAGWGEKHHPKLSVKAKYQPYAALRQRFWRQYLKQYDTDDTGTLSQLELTSMLDSLGSTLSSETIKGFFERFGKDGEVDELTFEEAIMCLEAELGRPVEERKTLEGGGHSGVVTGTATSAETPLVLQGLDGRGREIQLEELDFSGRPRVQREENESGEVGIGAELAPANYPTSSNQQTLKEVVAESGGVASLERDEEGEVLGAAGGAVEMMGGGGAPAGKKRKLRFGRKKNANKPLKGSLASSIPASSSGGSGNVSSSSDGTPSPSNSELTDSAQSANSNGAPPVERVINVKNCPMCHRPRMNGKAEMDIITHMALCASQDWSAVDKIMVGNFVTASQAQRKWYTKVLSKVSAGNYKLGANSANIIVQNRMTGQLEEEKMQVYVRLGIRLLYKGASSRMEGARARRLLKSLSIKQGIKYDDPASAKEIPSFLEFHNLNVSEILDPLDSFKTFNQFFYRKLKPSARPVESPDDPYRLVSAADCRFMAFSSVSEATKIWIKGRDFSVSRLLGENYKHEAERYNGGALAIFRLAPQDYHRFHSPVDGIIGNMTYISGEYYTVNPQAIRTALDVYGENARKIVPIDSPQFGRVMAVCVGAMMVGSIETTVNEGQSIKRGDEFGYFAFGGSTIVILFERGAVEWDEDLLINGRASLETLVRVNMGIGRGNPDKFPPA